MSNADQETYDAEQKLIAEALAKAKEKWEQSRKDFKDKKV